MRSQLTPSSLEGGASLRAADLLQLTPSDGVRRGRALHQALEAVASLDEVTDEQRRGWSDEVRRMLDRPAVAQALRLPSGPHWLWRERPFAVIDGDRTLHGVFDRVVVSLDADDRPTSAQLVDFKTDRVTGDPATLEARAGHYRPQVRAYRRGLSILLGLDEAKIAAGLVFLEPGRVVDVS